MTERPVRRVGAGLLGLAALTALVVLVAGRGSTWSGGEWTWLIDRGSLTGAALLDPSGGALVLLPVALLEAALAAFGLDGYGALRGVVLLVHLALAAGTFALLRARVGTAAAAVGAALVLVLGRTPDELVRVGQLGGPLAALGGVCALLGARRAGLAGGLLVLGGLSVALASSTLGLAFAVAVAVELIGASADGRGRGAAVAALVAPLVLYAVWVALAGGSPIDFGRIAEVGDAGVSVLASGAGAAVGQRQAVGWTLLVAGALALGAWGLRPGRRPSPRLVGAMAGLALAAVLVGLAPVGPDGSGGPAPLTVVVVLGLVAAAELVPRSVLAGRRPLVLACALVAVAALGGWAALTGRAATLRTGSQELRARLGATELVADVVGATDPVVPGVSQVPAGPLLRLEREHGRLGLTRTQLADAPAAARDAADDTLRRAGALRLTNDGRAAGQAPVVLGGVGVRVDPDGGPCVRITPADAATAGSVDVRVLPGGRITLEGTRATALLAWRFGTPPTRTTATVPVGRSTLAARADLPAGSPVVAWVARVGVASALRVCTAA